MPKFTKQVLLSLAVVGALAAGSGFTFSAFSATTSSDNNAASAGTVTLTDANSNDHSSLWSISNAKPGDSVTRCYKATYTGSLPATVHLYGTTTGTGLDRYLSLAVSRGIGAVGAGNTCVGFTADSSDYDGAGPLTAGELFDGHLSGYPTSYASGIVDPAAAWSNPTSVVYQFVVTQDDNNAAKGLSASTSLTWEARNN